MPTLRHDSSAAINPVETVTPPNLPPSDQDPSPGTPVGASRTNWLLLHTFILRQFQICWRVGSGDWRPTSIPVLDWCR